MKINYRRIVFALSLTALASALIGCSQGHCRRKNENKKAVEAQSPVQEFTERSAEEIAASKAKKVRIFKYDGSLQCGQGKAISVEAMARELKGIKIFSMEKKNDGLMHIQVCGSITGMANVYEIAEKDLPKAEKLDFRVWKYEE